MQFLKEMGFLKRKKTPRNTSIPSCVKFYIIMSVRFLFTDLFSPPLLSKWLQHAGRGTSKAVSFRISAACV